LVERFREVKNRYSRTSAFDFFGMKVEEVAEGKAVVSLAVSSRFYNSNGYLHGGVTATLVDTVIGVALKTLIHPKTAATVELKTNYLAPVKDGELRATGWIVRSGQKLAVGRADVIDGHGKLVACGSATYMILGEE